jgi:hypothetical protein
MGTKPARGGTVVLPFRLVYKEFRRRATVDASVVLPSDLFLWLGLESCALFEWWVGKRVPEPGMPETAIKKRSVDGMDWNFAELSS